MFVRTSITHANIFEFFLAAYSHLSSCLKLSNGTTILSSHGLRFNFYFSTYCDPDKFSEWLKISVLKASLKLAFLSEKFTVILYVKIKRPKISCNIL